MIHFSGQPLTCIRRSQDGAEAVLSECLSGLRLMSPLTTAQRALSLVVTHKYIQVPLPNSFSSPPSKLVMKRRYANNEERSAPGQHKTKIYVSVDLLSSSISSKNKHLLAFFSHSGKPWFSSNRELD